MTDLIGHTLGLYEIIEEIGHGGMADVYRAVQPSIGRQVAIKVLPAHFLQDRTFLERFNREVQVIARLQHPRILPIYDFGQHDGMPYIVMAYMPGGTLATRIRESGNGLPLGETVRLMGQIAEGLDFAHRQGVIHRDFKPSNVLLDVEGNAYLADFGVAKVTEATAQLTGSGIIGTPAYMAPEMARLGGVSALVDVYALGTTLYQMLTGQLPFQADTPMGVLLAHASMPIPDVRGLRPDLPEEVQHVIELGMAKEPADRYQSAGEVSAGLREAAKMPAVSAGEREETRAAQPTARRPMPSAGDGSAAGVTAPPASAPAPEDLGATLPAPVYVPATTNVVAPLPTEQASPTPPIRTRRTVPTRLWGIGAVIVALALGGGLIALLPSLGGRGQPTSAAISGQERATKAVPPAPIPTSAEPVELHLFVGVEGDLNARQVADEQKLVDAFNASHPNMTLIVEVVPGATATDELTKRIADGNAPDIVGPIGLLRMNRFYGKWLDLAPLMKETGYDTSDFDPALIKAYQFGPNGEQVGIPLVIFPSALWYNVAMFDAAKLPYPPHQYGAPYADGRPWDMNTLREIAMRLTLDGAGRDATSPSFDPGQIMQFGFDVQWTTLRGQATFFGAGSTVDEQGNAVIPPQWRDFCREFYDGMWRDHFIPTNEYRNSAQFEGGNGFGAGKVAMVPIHSWYIWRVGDKVRWNVAAMPSNGSQGPTAKLHANTFAILASTSHPREAFEALTYLLGEGAPSILTIHGGLPARKSLQGGAFDALNKQFPIGVDWGVFLEGLKYIDIPSHESHLPNQDMAEQRLNDFMGFYQGTPGLDMETEVNRLRDDLQGIFAQK